MKCMNNDVVRYSVIHIVLVILCLPPKKTLSISITSSRSLDSMSWLLLRDRPKFLTASFKETVYLLS